MEGADLPLPWRAKPGYPDKRDHAAGLPAPRTTEAPKENRWQEKNHTVPWDSGQPGRRSPGDDGNPPTIAHNGQIDLTDKAVSLAEPDSEPPHAPREQAAARKTPPPAKTVADNQLRELFLFGVVPVAFLCIAAAGYLFWRVTTAEPAVADPMPPIREEAAEAATHRG